ncbi:MAG: hypothetical protein R3321_14120, partial [Nitrososphaeraceae archaeon]|nr:hypothetical protein [Nitrososphaeraceae archaeon]
SSEYITPVSAEGEVYISSKNGKYWYVDDNEEVKAREIDKRSIKNHPEFIFNIVQVETSDKESHKHYLYNRGLPIIFNRKEPITDSSGIFSKNTSFKLVRGKDESEIPLVVDIFENPDNSKEHTRLVMFRAFIRETSEHVSDFISVYKDKNEGNVVISYDFKNIGSLKDKDNFSFEINSSKRQLEKFSSVPSQQSFFNKNIFILLLIIIIILVVFLIFLNTNI